MEMAILIPPSTRIAELEAENAELRARLAEFERQASGIPEIVIRAINILNVEIADRMIRLGSALADREEKKALSKEIQRKSAAIGVLTKIRGEVVGINRQWRIPSETGDRFYISLWDAQSDLGACNCQAGANGHECKHVEAARALTLASEMK